LIDKHIKFYADIKIVNDNDNKKFEVKEIKKLFCTLFEDLNKNFDMVEREKS